MDTYSTNFNPSSNDKYSTLMERSEWLVKVKSKERKERKPSANVCDQCRSKKRRCSGPGREETTCQYCKRRGNVCTYSLKVRKRRTKAEMLRDAEKDKAKLQAKHLEPKKSRESESPADESDHHSSPSTVSITEFEPTTSKVTLETFREENTEESRELINLLANASYDGSYQSIFENHQNLVPSSSENQIRRQESKGYLIIDLISNFFSTQSQDRDVLLSNGIDPDFLIKFDRYGRDLTSPLLGKYGQLSGHIYMLKGSRTSRHSSILGTSQAALGNEVAIGKRRESFVQMMTKAITEELKYSQVWRDLSVEAFLVVYQAHQTEGVTKRLFKDGMIDASIGGNSMQEHMVNRFKLMVDCNTMNPKERNWVTYMTTWLDTSYSFYFDAAPLVPDELITQTPKLNNAPSEFYVSLYSLDSHPPPLSINEHCDQVEATGIALQRRVARVARLISDLSARPDPLACKMLITGLIEEFKMRKKWRENSTLIQTPVTEGMGAIQTVWTTVGGGEDVMYSFDYLQTQGGCLFKILKILEEVMWGEGGLDLLKLLGEGGEEENQWWAIWRDVSKMVSEEIEKIAEIFRNWSKSPKNPKERRRLVNLLDRFRFLPGGFEYFARWIDMFEAKAHHRKKIAEIIEAFLVESSSSGGKLLEYVKQFQEAMKARASADLLSSPTLTSGLPHSSAYSNRSFSPSIQTVYSAPSPASSTSSASSGGNNQFLAFPATGMGMSSSGTLTPSYAPAGTSQIQAPDWSHLISTFSAGTINGVGTSSSVGSHSMSLAPSSPNSSFSPLDLGVIVGESSNGFNDNSNSNNNNKYFGFDFFGKYGTNSNIGAGENLNNLNIGMNYLDNHQGGLGYNLGLDGISESSRYLNQLQSDLGRSTEGTYI